MKRAWLFVLLSCSACGWDSGVDVGSGIAQGPILRRKMSVASDGCALDPWSASTLDGSARGLVSDVVLLCAVPRASGTVGPADASARTALADQMTWLAKRGYAPILGVDFTDETGARYDGAEVASFLASPTWQKSVIDDLATLAQSAGGVDVDFQSLPNDARSNVTTFIHDLASTLHGQKKTIGILIPPSTASPSDIPGGDAFDIAALSKDVDRMRVMTLDFSDQMPGPTIDTGWAVDAVRFATNHGAMHLDIAYPLYGVDFSSSGRRLVTTLEAWGLASEQRLPIQRTASGSPHLSYKGQDGQEHAVWFDDVTSTSSALRAWDADVLPTDVGVFFYGLGAEDPRLFSSLGAAVR